MYLAQAVVAGQIADFEKFLPRQKPASSSFNLDAVMQQVSPSSIKATVQARKEPPETKRPSAA
jgi:hypothetical protein